ncbi:MAG: methyltransferase domain-containing protein [Pseudomonadota bacterium]
MSNPAKTTLDIDDIKAFGASVSFGKTAGDYGRYRAGFPEVFFDELNKHVGLSDGDNAIDLGTGTGTVARGLARRGLTVTGIDPSPELMAEASRLDGEAGVTVTYVEGKAEQIQAESESVDLVTAGQCWHWFDRSAVANDVHRILRPAGRVVICHFDWLPLPGNVVAATEALILKFNPAWALAGGTGFYPDWLADLSGAGFHQIETRSFDHGAPYTHEAWRGRIRASAGVKATLSSEETAAFDAELAILLEQEFPDDPFIVPHRVWWVAAKKP